jgi:PAS domain S-box-containing protein
LTANRRGTYTGPRDIIPDETVSEAGKSDRAPRVIFAVENEEERSAFTAAMAAVNSGSELFFPSAIAEVEALYSKDRADAIVTDLRFHGGALADWLTFWPLPTVLLVDPDDDIERVGRTVRDEASIFLQRMPGLGHVRALPLLIRKALSIRESTARQNAHLQMSEHQYLNLLQAIPDIVYTLDGEGNFIYLNDAVRNLGYEPSSLIGRHFSVIVHPDDVARVSREKALPPLEGIATGEADAPKLFNERRSGKRMTRNLELRLRAGDLLEDYHLGSVTSYGEINCSGYALPEFEGLELGTIGIIRDVTVRRGQNLALEAALASREVLLKEIHHRVKNNLQVVSSLLNIQEPGIVDARSRKVFVECQTQIQTMAMVHEVLYRSSSFEGVDMQPYFSRLVDYLLSVYDGKYRDIACASSAEGVSLDLDDAIPVALIVNELVSNSLKHAFPAGRPGRVTVSLRENEGSWLLEVEDDGIGIAAPAAPAEGGESGIGTELVQALASQLRGELARSAGSRGAGTLVSMRFPRARQRLQP